MYLGFPNSCQVLTDGSPFASDFFVNRYSKSYVNMVSTACKLPVKFEPMKGKIKLTPPLIQPITNFVQILNFMEGLHGILSTNI